MCKHVDAQNSHVWTYVQACLYPCIAVQIFGSTITGMCMDMCADVFIDTRVDPPKTGILSISFHRVCVRCMHHQAAAHACTHAHTMQYTCTHDQADNQRRAKEALAAERCVQVFKRVYVRAGVHALVSRVSLVSVAFIPLRMSQP